MVNKTGAEVSSQQVGFHFLKFADLRTQERMSFETHNTRLRHHTSPTDLGHLKNACSQLCREIGPLCHEPSQVSITHEQIGANCTAFCSA